MARYGYAVSPSHRRLLESYWLFYCALAEGRRQPTTEAQQHFVAVSRGQLQPVTEHELAYLSGLTLIAYSRLSPDAVARRHFDLSPSEMADIELPDAVLTTAEPAPVQYHDVRVDRWSSDLRTVRRHNW